MRKELLVLIPLAIFASSAKGCFGDDEPYPEPGDGPPLSVTAATEGSGPFTEGEPVVLNATAHGGVAPYRFSWLPPAETLDPLTGRGTVTAAPDVRVTVEVFDHLGARATASLVIITTTVETATLGVEVFGPGSVEVDGHRCDSSCGFTGPAVERRLVARPDEGGRFLGWSACSIESAAEIVVAPDRRACGARFAPIDDRCDPAEPPVADLVVRPAIDVPPFLRDGEGRFLVPAGSAMVIDGTASFGQAPVTRRWRLEPDPNASAPIGPSPWFVVTSGAPGEETRILLAVDDRCGQTAVTEALAVTF